MLNFANVEKKRVLFFPEQVDELIGYFSQNPDATLIINFDKYFDYKNKAGFFERIKSIPFKKVLLLGNGSYDFDLKNLKSNEILIELDDNYAEIGYDFSGFPGLEILRYLYIKGSSNYDSLKNLKELSLWSYPQKNIDAFLPLSNLKDLRFVQSKVQSLKGIGQLEKLENLFLIANKDLVFDHAEPNPNIKQLYIDGCKKVDADSIPGLFPNLEKLTIMKNGEIDSLKMILDNLKNLTELDLMGTKIHEADNRYWKNYPNLKRIHFLDQPNLILRSDEFN